MSAALPVLKISVKVVPNAKSNEVIHNDDGSYTVRTTVSPTDGKANKKVIELLAKALGYPKSSLTIASGLTSKNKTIHIVPKG